MTVTRETHIKEWQRLVRQAMETPNQEYYIKSECRRAWLWVKHEALYHNCIILEEEFTIEFHNGTFIIVTPHKVGRVRKMDFGADADYNRCYD